MKIIFWLSFGVLFYVYFGYPLVLVVLAKLRKKPHKIDNKFFPPISIIIPVHNEEEVIANKLKNCLSLDYPNKIEIIVASDGSTDRTVEIATQFPGVKVRHFRKRRGKMAILNEAVCDAEHEVIVFTDANAMFKPDAIRKLVPHLADPTVGCVGGVKKIIPNGKIDNDRVGEHEKMYWGFESFLKTKEAEFGSTFVDGAIYAMKKELYPFPNHDSIIMDDLAISLGVINKKHRVVFEPSAIAYETASAHGFDEFRRKIRILNGAITSIRNFSIRDVVFQIGSHKILRWASFIFIIGLLGSNLFVRDGIYSLFLLVQVIFYVTALLGFISECLKKNLPKFFYTPFYFCLTNVAQAVGFIKYVSGQHPPFWEKLKR